MIKLEAVTRRDAGGCNVCNTYGSIEKPLANLHVSNGEAGGMIIRLCRKHAVKVANNLRRFFQ